MRVYAVGGSVRDELLGLPVTDRDWVVVGATPEEMLRLGYLPVGRDFPVFLHPQDREEYALARRERKSSPGYHGFVVHASPEVTLEEDLLRRDLTINAMARDADGMLIDPYGGARDLAQRVLRHVGPAFAEDPVRILRVARFAARYRDFTVAAETMEVMRGMVESGEADALVAERVWQELSRGLMEPHPSRMFDVLRSCGALPRTLPEIDRLFGVPQDPKSHPEIDTGDHIMRVVDRAAATEQALTVRFAALVHDLGKGTTPPERWPDHGGHEIRGVALVESLSERLRVPADCRDLAVITARLHGDVHQALDLGADRLLAVIESADGLRRPERFGQFLMACECDFRGRPGHETRPFPQAARLCLALSAARAVDAASIARGHPSNIPATLRAARIAAIAAAA